MEAVLAFLVNKKNHVINSFPLSATHHNLVLQTLFKVLYTEKDNYNNKKIGMQVQR